MSLIKRIDVRIVTGNRPTAEAEGLIYLGIAGREFRLNSPALDNFKRGGDRVYTLGEGANVVNEQYNDPRDPQLESDDLKKFPKYVRYEPKSEDDEWNIEQIVVTVNPEADRMIFSSLVGGRHIWLGQKAGLICYLP